MSSSFSPPHTRSTMSVSAKTESKHENVRYEYMFLQRLANPPFQLPQWNEKVQVEDFGGNVQTRRNSLRFSVPCSTTETTVFSVLVVHPVNLCLGLLVNPAPSASSMLDCPNALYWDCHGQLHINQKAQTSGSLTHPFYANLELFFVLDPAQRCVTVVTPECRVTVHKVLDPAYAWCFAVGRFSPGHVVLTRRRLEDVPIPQPRT